MFELHKVKGSIRSPFALFVCFQTKEYLYLDSAVTTAVVQCPFSNVQCSIKLQLGFIFVIYNCSGSVDASDLMCSTKYVTDASSSSIY